MACDSSDLMDNWVEAEQAASRRRRIKRIVVAGVSVVVGLAVLLIYRSRG